MTKPLTLALDPSSTATGWATGTSPGPQGLCEWGTIKASRPALRTWLKVLPAPLARIVVIQEQLKVLIMLHRPDFILVEVPTGHVNKRKRDLNMRGQSIYGMSVWAMLEESWRNIKTMGKVISISTQWTRGKTKEKRQAELAMEFKHYHPQSDRGANEADAIGMMQWWFAEQILERAKERS